MISSKCCTHDEMDRKQIIDVFCAPHVSIGQQYHTEKIVLNESSIILTLGVSARIVDVS